jgi:hypothetical protein
VENADELDHRKLLYELGFGLKVLAVTPSLELATAYRELQKPVVVDSAMFNKVTEEWKKAVVVRRRI